MCTFERDMCAAWGHPSCNRLLQQHTYFPLVFEIRLNENDSDLLIDNSIEIETELLVAFEFGRWRGDGKSPTGFNSSILCTDK